MHRILIHIVASLSLASVAGAQEAPDFAGSLSAGEYYAQRDGTSPAAGPTYGYSGHKAGAATGALNTHSMSYRSGGTGALELSIGQLKPVIDAQNDRLNYGGR